MASFACNMTALSSEERIEHKRLETALLSAIRGVRELPDGYAFEFIFSPATYTALADLTPLEHACCPFFDISIVLEHTDRLFWQLTGAEGVKLFIRAEFEAWFKQEPS